MTETQFLAFVAYMFVWSGVMITVILRDNRRLRRDIANPRKCGREGSCRALQPGARWRTAPDSKVVVAEHGG